MNTKIQGRKYKLRQTAKDNLKEIGRYALKNSGEAQRNYYLKGLAKHFKLLSESPKLGRPRDDIKKGCRCSDYGKHVVFYRIRKEYIDVLAVVPISMLPEYHLQNKN